MTHKCAILSDIHGNVEALRAVLRAAKQHEVDIYLIAGDIMGYYFRVPEVMDELRDLNAHIIRGNHEDLFLEWQNNIDMRDALEKKYGTSFAHNQNSLSKEDLNVLLSLPVQKELEIAGKKILLCHGTPWDKDEYLYPDAIDDKIQKLYSYDKDMIVFGHTHYPVLWRNGNQIVINPGSVGQPRDRKGGACWALWDAEHHSITLEREFYDTASVIKDCETFCPSITYLQDILTVKQKDISHG